MDMDSERTPLLMPATAGLSSKILSEVSRLRYNLPIDTLRRMNWHCNESWTLLLESVALIPRPESIP